MFVDYICKHTSMDNSQAIETGAIKEDELLSPEEQRMQQMRQKGEHTSVHVEERKSVTIAPKIREPRWKKAARVALGAVMSIFAAGSIPAGFSSVPPGEVAQPQPSSLPQKKEPYRGPLTTQSAKIPNGSEVVIIDSKGRSMSGTRGGNSGRDNSNTVQIEVPKEVSENLQSFAPSSNTTKE